MTQDWTPWRQWFMDLLKAVVVFIVVTFAAILFLQHWEDRRETARFARESMLQYGLETEREFLRESMRFFLCANRGWVLRNRDATGAYSVEEMLGKYEGMMQCAGLLITDAPKDTRLGDAYKAFLKQATLFAQRELHREAPPTDLPTGAEQPSSDDASRCAEMLSVMISIRSLVDAHREATLKTATEGT